MGHAIRNPQSEFNRNYTNFKHFEENQKKKEAKMGLLEEKDREENS